jgi:hypothetical protein
VGYGVGVAVPVGDGPGVGSGGSVGTAVGGSGGTDGEGVGPPGRGAGVAGVPGRERVGAGTRACPPCLPDAEALGDVLPAAEWEAGPIASGLTGSSSSNRVAMRPVKKVALMKSSSNSPHHLTTGLSKLLS